MFIGNKKCRIYAACGVSQTPIKRIKWEVTANVADEKIVPENGLEVRYERYKGIIKNFTLMSDIFMRNVFKQRECLEYVL